MAMSLSWELKLFVLIVIYNHLELVSSCIVDGDKYDLTPLSRFTWNITQKRGPYLVEYKLSLCSPLGIGDSCANSSICQIGKNGSISSTANLGNYEAILKADKDADDDGFWLKFKGGSCPEGGTYRTLINLQCSESLGSPNIIGVYGCTTYLLWETSVACAQVMKRKEVPCYTYDTLGRKYDLNHLILSKGGYLIKSQEEAVDFYINVCSDIATDFWTVGCPRGAGACQKIGNDSLSFGDIKEPLVQTKNGNLQLVYYHEGEQLPPECNTHPRTTITFICPSSGLDQLPVILSNSNCHYQVEWPVVNACPIQQIESKDGCTLVSNIDGIRIDLSHLNALTTGMPHHAQGIIDGKIYDFYFGLCGVIQPNYSCANSTSSSTRICRKSIDDYEGVIIGTDVNQTLRLSDNRVILSFGSGGVCQGNTSTGRLHSVIIIFDCDHADNYGTGEPRFLHEENCITFFKWKTKSVCVERREESICYASDGENIFDLTSLTKAHGEAAWQVIADSPDKHGPSQIYINVCGSVPNYANTASCPVDSAVCVKDKDGTMHDFGQYSSQPTFDPDTKDVLLHYISFETCSTTSNRTRDSVIRFACQPGVTNLGPQLVHASDDGCFLEFQWPSATACVQAAVEGSNCQIKHPSLGLLDLTPLRSSTFHNVSTEKYSFFINICSNLKEAPCLQNDDDIAACQIDNKNATKKWILGKVSNKLMYYNGIVNITFTDGTPYNDRNHTPRQTVIAFLCDWNAGVGKPVFIEEANQVYSFKWETVYVCPPRIVPCIYIDEVTQTQYDLSRLSRNPGQNDWEIDDLRGSRKFYLNVCRRLTHTAIDEGKCDNLASVCATLLENGIEKPFIANLGKAEYSPHVREGQLILNYSSGQPCLNGREGQNYTAIIYFMCADDPVRKKSEGPKFLRESQCQYMFEWNTRAACPLHNAEVSNSCALMDPNTRFTYSFDSLPSSFRISVKRPMQFQSFEISICGNLNSSACGDWNPDDVAAVSVCGRLRDSKKSVVLGLSDSRRLRISKEGAVSVHFDGPVNISKAEPDYQVEITFLCHRNLASTKPSFVHREGKVFFFEYETAITCPPQEVECIYRNGRGSVYDLSSLSYSTGHWEVRDPRPEKQNTVYHLNVCQSVKASSDSNCSRGTVGACEQDVTTGKTWSLGHVQSRPQMSISGQNSVTLKYLNGDLCNDGQFHRKTTIDFTCSTKQEGPRFIEETAQCEYIFSWETPAACPVKQSLGKNCQVSDPVYNYIFDFNKLSNTSGYTFHYGNKTFKINLCSPLKFDCGGNKQASVCMETNGQMASSGNFSSEFIYDRGEITLSFEGAHFLLMISFLCDYSSTGKQGPVLSDLPPVDGLYFLTWKTSYACRSFKDSTCRAFGPNNTLYDLSRLTLLSSNHESVTNDGKYKYLINVCRSVVHGKDAQCHYGAGVCEVNISEANLEKRYSSIGEIGNGPVVENGVLKIVYAMGELCQNPNISILHKKAVIEFYCSPFIEEGSPLFLSNENCEYRFAWYTSAACPIIQEDTVGGDCTTMNPNTGYKFDLNVLRNTSYVVESVEYRFTLGVCEGARSNPCGPDVGSCQQVLTGNSTYYNAGEANSKLHYRNGVLLLNYTNWEPCPHLIGSDVWATVITFVCGKDKLSPAFVGLNGCLYLFEWHTDLACEKQIHCSIEVDNEIFDLSPIGDYGNHHIAFSSDESDSATYLLNVCRPLNQLHNPLCPSEAAACRINYSTNVAYSLGHAEKPPAVDAQGHIILEYVHGSTCPFNEQLNASSRIIFKCDDRFIPGVLQMVEVTPECTYIFEWPTNVVCPSVTHGYVSPNCTYFDRRNQKNFDLTQLYALSPDRYQVESRRGTFTISLCGTVAKEGPCAAAGICLETDGKQESWGTATSRTFIYDSQILKVSYGDGDSCPLLGAVSRFSSILFICDLNAGSGKPELLERNQCEAIFTWKTSLVCTKQEIQCDLIYQGELYDLRLLSSYSHSWTVDVSAEEKFWVNICGTLGVQNNPRCPTDSAVCWKTAAGKVMSIGAAQNQMLYMADDGHTLLLRYSTSTNACFHGPNNSGLPTWSEIKFKCSLRTKNLKFISRGNKFNNCTFTFEWETPVACPERRIVKLEIEERNGKLENGYLGLYLDLSSLLASNVTALEKRGEDQYRYHIALTGLSNFNRGKCDGAAICQVKVDDGSFQRSIGNVDNKKFYLQGSELIVILQSSSQCGRNAEKNATSHIILQCSLSAGMGQPEFIYESLDCNYIFTWQTNLVCDPVLLYPFDADPMMVHQDSSHVGVAVGITCLVIVTSIAMFVIFRKQCRRICFFLSCESLSTISSSLATNNRQGSSSISFARLSEEEANS